MKKKKLTKNDKVKTQSNGLFPFKWFLCSMLALLLFSLYLIFLASNVNTKPAKNYFYVSKLSLISEVADSLEGQGIISNSWTLSFVSRILESVTVRPGLYKIDKGWNNYQLVNHLKSDSLRSSMEIKITAVQQRKNLLKQLCSVSNLKEREIILILKDSVYLKALGGFTKESIYSIFIPQTYRVYNNVQSRELIEMLYFGYCRFWNEDRLEKAEELGHSPQEIGVLASIVYAETKNAEEMPIIAGLYLNRLNKNMRLESDPTLVYATGNFSSQRVLRKYAEINSPYNTYRRKGLPPGPIFIAPPQAIDAVLNYTPHDYIFFCAKDDFSGCHIFSESYEEHKENANRYRKELDKRKIN